MRIFSRLPKLFLAGAVFFGVQTIAVQSPGAKQVAQADAQLADSEQRLGPFLLGGQEYSVVLHKKSFAGNNLPNAPEAVEALEILDAAGNRVYQEMFTYEAGDGRFTRGVSVTATLFSGRGGAALAIRYSETPATTAANESWLVLGMVNGKLTSMGAPVPLGQDPGIATGGVLAGVMLRGGIGVLPMASTAEPLEFRVWTGNFHVLVPVHVDWTRGKWSEGEQCFELFNGTLRPKGCNLRVQVSPRPRADITYAQLYAQTEENRYESQRVLIRPDSSIEFPQARVIVKWNAGEHFSCTFDDVWLQVLVDGKQGWVHGEQDFAALGLPLQGSP